MRSPALFVEHLTLVHTPPPRFARAAAGAGFAGVGIRVAAPDGGPPPFDLTVGSRTFQDTTAVLAGEGIGVLGVEVVAVTGTTTPDDYLPALESGAALGARYVNVAVWDPDAARRRVTIAVLAEHALAHGIVPQIEFMPYSAVRTLAEGLDTVSDGGAGVQVDTLHLVRSGGRVADLRAANPDRFAYLQLADAPAEVPATLDALREEARTRRRAPGAGDLPLVEMCALFTGKAVAVEAPHDEQAAEMGEVAFLKMLRETTSRVLGRTPTGSDPAR